MTTQELQELRDAFLAARDLDTYVAIDQRLAESPRVQDFNGLRTRLRQFLLPHLQQWFTTLRTRGDLAPVVARAAAAGEPGGSFQVCHLDALRPGGGYVNHALPGWESGEITLPGVMAAPVAVPNAPAVVDAPAAPVAVAPPAVAPPAVVPPAAPAPVPVRSLSVDAIEEAVEAAGSLAPASERAAFMDAVMAAIDAALTQRLAAPRR